MFKKIVSQIPFSSSLIRDLGKYAQRVKREQKLYAVATILTAIVIIIQIFFILSPTETANSSNSSDLIRGGISSPSQLPQLCNANDHGFKDILLAANIACSDLENLHYSVVHTRSGTKYTDWLVWSRASRFGDDYKEKTITIAKNQIFIRPIYDFENKHTGVVPGAKFKAFSGRNSKGEPFAILANSGNILTNSYPANSTQVSCVNFNNRCANIEKQIKVVDSTTMNEVASESLLKPGHKLEYSLTVKNNEATPISVPVSVNLADALEYSTIHDEGGSKFNNAKHTLDWGEIMLRPQEQHTYTYVLNISHQNGTISPMPQGKSDPTSYDCRITSHFGNTVSINLDCPKRKLIEHIISELPKTQAHTNVIITTVIFVATLLLYCRARLLGKELKIVRKDMNSGAI